MFSSAVKRIIPIVLIFAIMFMTGCDVLESYIDMVQTSSPDSSAVQSPTTGLNESNENTYEGLLHIYFIDVGQGDSILLISPSNKTMLVDAGERNCYSKISLLMESLNIDSLDAVVATHPHSDHIGGMEDIINNHSISTFYMPDKAHDTKTYQNMMEALSDNNIQPTYIYGGVDSKIEWDPDININVLSPLESVKYGSDLNDYSIMMNIAYGSVSVLLTGDCTEYSETSALYLLPDEMFVADILKVAHHGSSTSSSFDFVTAVNPSYAVISLGWDNKYGHPHNKTLTTLEKIGAQIMRTDEMGTIHFVLDGNSVAFVND